MSSALEDAAERHADESKYGQGTPGRRLSRDGFLAGARWAFNRAAEIAEELGNMSRCATRAESSQSMFISKAIRAEAAQAKGDE